jgi:Protein of unknown function (DUF3592)
MMDSSSRLRWSHFGGWRTLLSGLLVAGFGLSIMASMLLVAHKERAYRSQGVSVNARVIDKGISAGFRRQPGRPSTEFWLRYEYRDVAGKVHRGKENEARDLWAQYQRGSPVRVQYLRTRPGESRLARRVSRWAWLVGAGIFGLGLLFIAGASVGTVQAWRDAAKRVREEADKPKWDMPNSCS